MIFRKKKPKLTPVTKTEVVKRIVDSAVVRIGNGNKTIVVFFDLRCPFCARLFRETEDILLGMAQKGLIAYAMCDYIVHKDAEPLHKALRCMSPEERLKAIKEIFSGNKLALSPCNSADLGGCQALAEELGVYGTPTLLFYDFAKGRGYIHFGYMTPDEVMESISTL